MNIQKPTLSLCMIVKNEEENLPQCLEPVKDAFDQIVVVDTGSEDNTVEIAKNYGAEVHYFPWIDDFSAARNESLKHATGDWIFWLDADDRMERQEALKLRELITPEKKTATKVYSAFYCMLYCYEANEQDTETLQMRLFPNLPGVEFEGLVHEQVFYSLHRLDVQFQVCDVKIIHTGYKDADAFISKIHRNMALLEKQIQKTPDRVNVRLHLVTHYNALGETEKSIEELDKIIEQIEGQEGYKEAYLICCVMLGNNYRKINQDDAAEEMYQKALDMEPGYGLAHFLLGELYYRLGRISEARMQLLMAQHFGIQLCRTPIPIQAIYYYTSYFLGKCHENTGDMNLAIMEYQRALQIKPQSAEAYTCLGSTYMRHGQYEHAQKAFDMVCQLSEQDATEEEHSDEESISSAIALQLSLERATNYYNLGIAYLHQGKLDEAEKAFKRVIEAQPDSAEAYSNLALIYSKQERLVEAENNYLKAIQIKSNCIEALTNLAHLYLKNERLSEAEEKFLLAAELQPGALDVHFALSYIYAQREELNKIQKQYAQIVYVNPELSDVSILEMASQTENPEQSGGETKNEEAMLKQELALTFNYLGEWLISKNPEFWRIRLRREIFSKHAEVILTFETALTLAPNLVTAQTNLANLYQETRNYEKAIEMYEVILRADPKNYSAFYQLGDCYLSMGVSDAARLCYLHALELNPNFEPAQEQLTRLTHPTSSELGIRNSEFGIENPQSAL